MKEQRRKLLDKITKLNRELDDARGQLARLDRSCNHQWGEPEADHIHHEGYTTPGDPPGTMGVDWRGPTHVPARTEKRWKRTCQKCGKVECTTRIAKKTIEGPQF